MVDHNRFYRVYPIEDRILTTPTDDDLLDFFSKYMLNNETARVLLSCGPPVTSLWESDFASSQSESELEDFHLTFR